MKEEKSGGNFTLPVPKAKPTKVKKETLSHEEIEDIFENDETPMKGAPETPLSERRDKDFDLQEELRRERMGNRNRRTQVKKESSFNQVKYKFFV